MKTKILNSGSKVRTNDKTQLKADLFDSRTGISIIHLGVSLLKNSTQVDQGGKKTKQDTTDKNPLAHPPLLSHILILSFSKAP